VCTSRVITLSPDAVVPPFAKPLVDPETPTTAPTPEPAVPETPPVAQPD
jgi:hypothetical protein